MVAAGSTYSYSIGVVEDIFNFFCNCLQKPFISHPKEAVTLLIITPDSLSRNDELLNDASKYSPYINIALHINESLLLIHKNLAELLESPLWFLIRFDKYGLQVDRELFLNKMLKFGFNWKTEFCKLDIRRIWYHSNDTLIALSADECREGSRWCGKHLSFTHLPHFYYIGTFNWWMITFTPPKFFHSEKLIHNYQWDN